MKFVYASQMIFNTEINHLIARFLGIQLRDKYLKLGLGARLGVLYL